MQAVVPLNTSNSNYYSTDIVVSLDDKYVGFVIGESSDKIIVLSEECEAHDRFEIPKCKIMIISSPSINKRMILDLEYSKILKYKIDYDA